MLKTSKHFLLVANEEESEKLLLLILIVFEWFYLTLSLVYNEGALLKRL